MKTKKMVTTAMLLAFGFVLSLIQVFALPFGGSITAVSMLPIVLIGFMYGIKWGIFSSLIYSVLQLLAGFGTVSAFFLPGDSQMVFFHAVLICIIDYIIAYTCLGFGGIFKNRVKSDTLALCLGIIFSLMLRYIAHIVSGAIFFSSWAEWFFADSTGLMQIGFMRGFCEWVMTSLHGNALGIFYSVVYNGAYMIPEIIITTIVAPIVYRVLSKTKVLD